MVDAPVEGETTKFVARSENVDSDARVDKERS